MIKKLTLEELAALGHDLVVPFTANINETQNISISAVLRILPGKRIVAIGRPHPNPLPKGEEDSAVLVKIFFYTRNFLQETQGYERIKNSNVLTPPLLGSMALTEGGLCFYQLLENPRSFEEAWKAAAENGKQEMIGQLLAALKKMYDAGFYQSDLHLGNFIYSSGQLFALDPASCESVSQAEKKAENLATLLAQFPLADWPGVAEQIKACLPELEKESLQPRAKIKWQQRMDDFLRKIYRDCTYIRVTNKALGFGQKLSIRCVRESNSLAMQGLLENIQKIPEHAEILKRADSSIVSCLALDSKKMVIKNSRNKNIWRLLRRCLRRSRASNSWHYAHLLIEAGINTPKPIALVERKLGPLVLESWYISEHIEGDNLLDVWLYQSPSPSELSQIRNIFVVLNSLQLLHGDMKATNLLVADEKIYLIDYDGMERASSRTMKKDAERFLQNWPGQPWLSEVSALITPE